jgi:GNAT superfamily N-acetyltransferase
MKKSIEDYQLIRDDIGDYEFGWAGPEDMDFIIGHRETHKLEALSRRLDEGHRCFLAKRYDRIAAINWVSFNSGCVLFGRERELFFFPLDDRCAFTYDLYTYSEYRRQGIGLQLKKVQFEWLRKMGMKYVYTFILLSNTASLRIHYKIGSIPERLIYCYGIKNWKRAFLGKPGQTKRLKQWIKSIMNN